MDLIDTHAHIYLNKFDKDIGEVIQRAREESVSRICLPNIDSGTIGPMLRLENEYPGICLPMIGLHPGSVDRNFEDETGIIEDWLNKRSFAGIGETGTDLYWDKTHFDRQVASLEIHIDLAIKHDLPLILHSRDSLEENIGIIERNHRKDLTGIFHCFTGSAEQAHRIIDMGFMLGIGGIVTFKNSDLDKVLEGISPEHIVLETDSPYLAPHPYRGKRNEPSYLARIAEKLVEIYDFSLDNIARITTENAKKTFKIG